jgi:hypothetical protein
MPEISIDTDEKELKLIIATEEDIFEVIKDALLSNIAETMYDWEMYVTAKSRESGRAVEFYKPNMFPYTPQLGTIYVGMAGDRTFELTIQKIFFSDNMAHHVHFEDYQVGDDAALDRVIELLIEAGWKEYDPNEVE